MGLKWFREVTRELKRSGITVISIEQGNKHAKVRVTNGRASGFVSISVSPSDWRMGKNIVRDARRVLAKNEEENAHP